MPLDGSPPTARAGAHRACALRQCRLALDEQEPPRSWRSCAAGSMGCRWPSSWPRPGCAVLSPAAILGRLEPRCRLLRGGAQRSASPPAHDARRHRLEPRPLVGRRAALFRRLAVFAGGFTLEGVEGVIGGGGEDDGRENRRAPSPSERSDIPTTPSTLDLLAALIDKSLLQRMNGHRAEPAFHHAGNGAGVRSGAAGGAWRSGGNRGGRCRVLSVSRGAG